MMAALGHRLVAHRHYTKGNAGPVTATRPASFPVSGVLCAPLYDYSAATA